MSEMDTWRLGVHHDWRQPYVDRILHSFKEHLDTAPTSRVVRGDLRTLALHVEKAIFVAATDQYDYRQKFYIRLIAIEKARARARVTDLGMAEATDIQESQGAVPIQNLSDGGPLQKVASGEEDVVADFPNARVTDSSSGLEDLLTEVLQDFPNAIVMESSDGEKLIFLL